jgi:hypothetical protein
VETDSEFYVNTVNNQLFNPWNNSRCGNRDMSFSQRKSVLGEHHLNGGANVVVIEQGFTHSHKDDVADGSKRAIVFFAETLPDVSISV